MICGKCGKENPDGAVYCMFCGERLDGKKLCPNCGSDVQESFVSCPNCGQKLTASCGKCGTPLRPEWKLCPQCGTEITEIGTFTPPVMNKGSNNKKLIGVVIAILLIPIVLIVIAFCGFVSYGTITGHDVIKEEVFKEVC